jgi:hypothetical protein
MIRRAVGPRRALALLAVAAIPGAGAAAGFATAPVTAHPNPIVLKQGVPVGVQGTPGGAVAAADNYVATEDRDLLSVRQLRTLVEADWAPSARSVELAQPYPAAALTGKLATFAGLHVVADVAADRLEAYAADSAQVDVWAEVTLWSPAIVPMQRWELDAVSLIWSHGQWLIASRSSSPDAQTPVPSWTSGGPGDRTSSAFDARLAGMSTPYYGAAP